MQRRYDLIVTTTVPGAPQRGASPCQEAPLFLVAAIVAMALALILRLASITGGVFLTWQTFTILGLLLFLVHTAVGWWPARHGT